MAKKKELDGAKERKLKETKEFVQAMRVKASTVGNIVGKAVPVSMTEVSLLCYRCYQRLIASYVG